MPFRGAPGRPVEKGRDGWAGEVPPEPCSRGLQRQLVHHTSAEAHSFQTLCVCGLASALCAETHTDTQTADTHTDIQGADTHTDTRRADTRVS